MSDNSTMKKELLRLFKYLLDIQLNTDYCVFYDISGHVDTMSIRIARSKSDYENIVYRNSFIHLDRINKTGVLRRRLETVDWKKKVDEIIESIDEKISRANETER